MSSKVSLGRDVEQLKMQLRAIRDYVLKGIVVKKGDYTWSPELQELYDDNDKETDDISTGN